MTLTAIALSTVTMCGGGALQARCTEVPADGVIRRAGRYCVSGERVAASGIGIDVAAPDVTLDLRNARLRAMTADPKSVGINVRQEADRALVIGGTIENFTIGLSHVSGSGLRVDAVTFRRIGAIGILSSGNGARLRGNVVESVGGQPLDAANAYGIAVNLTGRGVDFQHNTIRDVQRQRLPANVVGEAVGILVGEGCEDCVIGDNDVAKMEAEAESIGIWNSGKGKVEIRRNRLSGFDQSVISLGRQFVIYGNDIRCAAAPRSAGLVMSLGRGGAPDGEGSAMANRFQSCAIDQMICDNGCRSPWTIEMLQKLARPGAGR